MIGSAVIGRQAADGFAAQPTRTIAGMVSQAIAMIAREVRIKRDREHLYTMPDYLLHDIGITRRDIDRAVSHGGAAGGNGSVVVMRRSGIGE